MRSSACACGRATLSSRPAAASTAHSGRARPLARAAAGDRPRQPPRPLRARLRPAIWPAAELDGAVLGATYFPFGPVHKCAGADPLPSALGARRWHVVAGPRGQGGGVRALWLQRSLSWTSPTWRCRRICRKHLPVRVERGSGQGTGGMRPNPNFARGKRGGVAAWRRWPAAAFGSRAHAMAPGRTRLPVFICAVS